MNFKTIQARDLRRFFPSMKAWCTWCCLLLALPLAAIAGDHPDASKQPDLVIVYTGDGRLKIEPTGCCMKIGGMARRATRIAEIRDQYPHVVVLDCGDYLKKRPGDPADDIRPAHVHRALNRIGYDAVNIAGGELAAGETFLKLFVADPAMPLVSANVRFTDGKDNRHWPPYRIKKREKINVGVIGLAEQTDSPMFEVSDPAPAIRAQLSEIEAKADIIVLLSHLKWEPTKAMVRENPSIDLAIVGYDDYATFDPETEGNTLMVKSVFDGGVLGVVKIWTDEQRRIARMENSLEMLETKISPRPEYEALEADYRAEQTASQARLNAEKFDEIRRQKMDKFMKMTPGEFLDYARARKGKLD